MIQPKSNYHDLFNQIEPLLMAEVVLSEFDAAKLKREINNIPDVDERLFLLALFYTLQVNEDKALETFEKLDRNTYEDIIVQLNYIAALERLNRPITALDRALKCLDIFDDIDLLCVLLGLQVKVLDVIAADKTLETIQLKLGDVFPTKIVASIESSHFLKEFVQDTDGLSYELLAETGRLALSFVEQYRINSVGVAYSSVSDEKCLSVKYLLKSESYSSFELNKLNTELIDLMIEHDFDNIPVIQQFYRVS